MSFCGGFNRARESRPLSKVSQLQPMLRRASERAGVDELELQAQAAGSHSPSASAVWKQIQLRCESERPDSVWRNRFLAELDGLEVGHARTRRG